MGCNGNVLSGDSIYALNVVKKSSCATCHVAAGRQPLRLLAMSGKQGCGQTVWR
jgi:hypothetical protein